MFLILEQMHHMWLLWEVKSQETQNVPNHKTITPTTHPNYNILNAYSTVHINLSH